MNIPIVDLFYNFIPGVLFTLIWSYIFNLFKPEHYNNSFALFIFLIISLFVGFFSPCYFKCHKKTSNRYALFIFLIISLFVGFFLHAILSVTRKHLIDNFFIFTKNFKITREEFWTRNRELWEQKKERLPQYFATRAALLGNLTIGSFLTIFVAWKTQCYWSIISFGAFFIFILFYIYYRKKEINIVMEVPKKKINKETKV